jgi:AraC family transcriptional regulator
VEGTASVMNLTASPEIIMSTPAFLVYLEKIGPFSKTAPLAWKEFWALAGGQFDQTQITGMAGLSRIDPAKTGDDAFVYQAGITLEPKPSGIPRGLQSRELKSGKYARFLLTGPYMQLPAAYPKAFSILEDLSLAVRDDFCVERYLNTPQDTPEDRLETEILIPLA